MTDPREEPRERVEAAADKHLRAMWARFQPTFDGYPPVYAERLADDVLDALGLSIVGWLDPAGRLHGPCLGRTQAHRFCEPVYRLAAPSGPQEGNDE